MQIYQHLRAPNDSSGNPRRVWVVYDLNNNGQIYKVYDEGYRGLPKELQGLVQLPSIAIPVSEYSELTSFDNVDWPS